MSAYQYSWIHVKMVKLLLTLSNVVSTRIWASRPGKVAQMDESRSSFGNCHILDIIIYWQVVVGKSRESLIWGVKLIE